MATTITKTETLVGKRIRRREDPRLITGTATYVDDIKMPGMHYAVDRAQPARGGEHPVHRHQQGRGAPRRRGGLHRASDTEHVGPGPCGASLPGLRVPHHHILAHRPRVLRRPSGSRGGRDGSLYRGRCGGSGRSRLGSSARPSPIRKKRWPRARRRCIRNGPITRRSIFTRKHGEIDKAFARSRCGRQAAHHQPAPDSDRDGNARRGGGVARGRSRVESVFVDADSAPDADAGGA